MRSVSDGAAVTSTGPARGVAGRPLHLNPRFEPLFGARALAAWVRSGGRPERKVRAYFPRLWWHATLFEHNWRMQASRMVGTGCTPDPVFIVGLWRSGTTVFHELLTELTGWSTPQTWQCFNPSTCFLSSAPPIERTIQRPMDQGRISSRGPQEDEFAALLLGEPSIYRGFIDPRRLGECAAELWSTGSDARNADRLARWRRFIRGLSLPAAATPLLLKSPSHTFRLPMLRAWFPRAKFIWIGRHTGEVMASNRKMWSAMSARHGLWAGSDAVLDQFLRDMLPACAAVLSRCLDDMPRENLLWVDFEELRTCPSRVLRRALQFLGCEGETGEGRSAEQIDQVLARIPIHAGARASLAADEAVEKLENLMAAARQRFG